MCRCVYVAVSAASTKSAPRRSGDISGGNLPSCHASPQRSPLHEGAETCEACDRARAAFMSLNEVRSTKERRLANLHMQTTGPSRPQRSPLHEGAETAASSASRTCGVIRASTKSAPRRSGDDVIDILKAAHAAEPQRSPLHEGAETSGLGISDPSLAARPQRSPLHEGAETKPTSSGGPATLQPQRSPLHEGAETLVLARPSHGAFPASTKSAPRRSGDGAQIWRRILASRWASTKSAPRRSGDEVGAGDDGEC